MARTHAWVVLTMLGALALPAQASALGDLIPPESAAQPPATASTTTFDIPVTASDDPGGSGLAKIDLYVQAPGELSYTDVASIAPGTPSFTYTATAGDGVYSFYSVATDNDGNVELPPLTGPDGSTTVNTAALPDPTPPPPDPTPPSDTSPPSTTTTTTTPVESSPTTPLPTDPIAQLPADAPLPPTPPGAPASPAAPSEPQLPLVAALTMPGHQTLRAVLARGLAVNLYAYRRVTLRLGVLLPAGIAKRIGLRPSQLVASRIVTADKPGVYAMRLRFKRNAKAKLRRLKDARVMVQSTLSANGARSTSTTAIKLPRRA